MVGENGTGPGYIYCQIEHQSTSNKLIAFRMMRYAIAAMQNHLDGYKTLPMVVLLLFTTVLRPLSLFAVLAGLFRRSQTGKALYASAFPLIDVTVMPDDRKSLQHRRMAPLD